MPDRSFGALKVAVCAGLAAALAWGALDDRTPAPAAAVRREPPSEAGSANAIAAPVSLHGGEAIAHLKQEGAYDSLVAAMTRARYAINRVEPTPRSN